jgi:hypothetical protein
MRRISLEGIQPNLASIVDSWDRACTEQPQSPSRGQVLGVSLDRHRRGCFARQAVLCWGIRPWYSNVIVLNVECNGGIRVPSGNKKALDPSAGREGGELKYVTRGAGSRPPRVERFIVVHRAVETAPVSIRRSLIHDLPIGPLDDVRFRLRMIVVLKPTLTAYDKIHETGDCFWD